MPISELIKGILLPHKPAGISKCGMSHATFAQHRSSSQWYELSASGQTIGSPLDLDFYKHDVLQGSSTRSREKTEELSKV
ncbi:MAG: hypothetical protein HC851_24760 [Acaryochloris sp. RU_4_1]|nr:hypothetical protein [Acaryochloris sp. RU_4_1]